VAPPGLTVSAAPETCLLAAISTDADAPAASVPDDGPSTNTPGLPDTLTDQVTGPPSAVTESRVPNTPTVTWAPGCSVTPEPCTDTESVGAGALVVLDAGAGVVGITGGSVAGLDVVLGAVAGVLAAVAFGAGTVAVAAGDEGS
jgi:hypothetical protein